MSNPEHTRLEEGLQLQLDFTKLQQIGNMPDLQVVPVVVQDADSGEVLILAYANRQALQETLERGIAVFWSTSRNELWIKGATSGETLPIVDVRVNCEQNSLLYQVRAPKTGACHTRDSSGRYRSSCYYRRLTSPDGSLENLKP